MKITKGKKFTFPQAIKLVKATMATANKRGRPRKIGAGLSTVKRKRGRPRTSTLVKNLAHVPDVYKSIQANNNILMHLFLFSGDDLELFFIWKRKNDRFLTRFWGSAGNELQTSTDPYNPIAFQKTLDDLKAKHYKAFDDKSAEDFFSEHNYIDVCIRTIQILPSLVP